MLFLFIKEVIEKNIFWVSHKYCQGQGWNIKLRFFLPGFEVLKTKKIRVFPRFFAMWRETLLFSSLHLFSLLVTNISYLLAPVCSQYPATLQRYVFAGENRLSYKQTCLLRMEGVWGHFPSLSCLFSWKCFLPCWRCHNTSSENSELSNFKTSCSRSLPLVAGKVRSYQVTATPRTLITWERRRCPPSRSLLIARNCR